MSFAKSLGLSVLASFLCLSACKHQAPQAAAPQINFRQPLPEGMVALRKIDPSQYPDFGAQAVDPLRLRASIEHSLEYLSAPSSRNFFPYLDITHARAVETLHRLDMICGQSLAMGRWDGPWFNQQIPRKFRRIQELWRSRGRWLGLYRYRSLHRLLHSDLRRQLATQRRIPVAAL